jgi:predicted unusual protein kinase regulating ubiquinone biosynthesis (AarF/ABC1/UbiB family)
MFRRRYLRIVFFFARSVLSVMLWDLILAHIGLRRWAERTRPARARRIATGFRSLAVQLGGVLIKVGQFLSSRLDVLPIEVTDELAALQDEVPPEDFAGIRRLVEVELGGPLSDHFAEFQEEPLAAASLGQVHRARLRPPGYSAPAAVEDKDGPPPITDIVIKVQRPQIETIIATDLAALRTLGSWLRRYPPIRRRVDLPALLAEFTRILYEEIDYLAEGQNAETFGINFEGQAGVCVPRVIWTHTTKRVLALEDVYAIKITDYEGITAAGVDRVEVAQRLADTYMKQIFADGFFHADPHPGNLFVLPTEGEEGDWRLVFVDFGMAGRVPSTLRAGLRELVIAVGTRDASRLVDAYQTLGVLLPHADLELIKKAEGMAFERFWGKSIAELREISFQEMHEFAREFRELVYTMPFQIPQDLILLGRAMAILFGMCSGLDPQFNPWESIEPYAQQLLAEEAGSNWEFWLGELGNIARSLLALPRRTEAVLGKIERGELEVRVPDLAGQIGRMELATRRMAGAVVFAALLMGGAQLYLAGETTIGGSLLGAAGVALAWTLLSRERR